MTYYFLKKKDFKKMEKMKKECDKEYDPGLCKDLYDSFSNFYYYIHNYIIKDGVDCGEYKKMMKRLEWLILCCENECLEDVMDDKGYYKALEVYKAKGPSYPYFED